jgi:hypothetical protein
MYDPDINQMMRAAASCAKADPDHAGATAEAEEQFAAALERFVQKRIAAAVEKSQREVIREVQHHTKWDYNTIRG